MGRSTELFPPKPKSLIVSCRRICKALVPHVLVLCCKRLSADKGADANLFCPCDSLQN